MHATPNPVSAAPTRLSAADPAQVIAVWADDDEPGARIFTPDDYADWAETNHLTDVFPDPFRFYAVTTDGALTELRHTVHVGPYDDNDYATVTHDWVHLDSTGAHPYATGVSRRDGRA